jgi:protein-disulfide isomerase
VSEQLEHPRLRVDVGADDHVRGPASAPLTLVEYGDYECPYCGAAYPIVKEVERILGDDLRSVFPQLSAERHPPARIPGGRSSRVGRCSGPVLGDVRRLF